MSNPCINGDGPIQIIISHLIGGVTTNCQEYDQETIEHSSIKNNNALYEKTYHAY